MSVSQGRPVRIILWLAMLAAGLGVLAWRFDLGAQITRCIEVLRHAGPGPFFTAMAVLPIFGFPLSPFTFAAGPVFGPAMGAATVVACAILATVVNVALSYWVAARALRPHHSLRSFPSQNGSRTARRSSLPTALLGISSMKRMSFGAL